MSLRRLLQYVALHIALSSTPLFAHDLWLEPTDFSPKPGDIVGVRMRVGQNLVGDAVPHVPALAREFVVQDALERRPLVARRGAEPAGLLRVMVPGLSVVGYRSERSTIDLEAEKFNAYLVDEGLEAIAAERARRGESGKSTRELYSRCAKSLIFSPAPNAAQGDRSLGYTLELVAERNPYTMAERDRFPVQPWGAVGRGQ